ncbi:hypothetical protein ACHWUR_00150 [Klebsiella pneumoniae]
MAGEVVRISSTVGVEQPCISKVLQDDSSAIKYTDVKKMEGAVKVKIN